jgi:hypothetical protein
MKFFEKTGDMPQALDEERAAQRAALSRMCI